MSRKKLVILVIIIIAAVISGYLIWNNQNSGPKTVEEIQKEIDRLKDLLRQAEEDINKAESGEVACTLVYQPACGKDGRTYSNSCFASAAGVEVDYKGECKYLTKLFF